MPFFSPRSKELGNIIIKKVRDNPLDTFKLPSKQAHALGRTYGAPGLGAIGATLVSPFGVAAGVTHGTAKLIDYGVRTGYDTTTIAGKLFATITDVPVFYRLSILIVFFAFFYKIFYDIFIFFEFNSLEIIIYLSWFAVLLLLLSFLNVKRSNLYTKLN